MAYIARTGLFIVGAKRTPFGAFGGSLKAFTSTDGQEASQTKGPVDHRTSGLRDPRAMRPAGAQEHGTSGLQDHVKNRITGQL